LPFIPTLAVTSPSNYGRLDPENESILSVVDNVASEVTRYRPKPPNMLHVASSTASPRGSPDSSSWSNSSGAQSTKPLPPLLALPPELLHAILAQLEPLDVAAVSATCKALHEHSFSDLIWQQFIQRQVNVPITSTGPCKSYRDLYIAHERFWFLAKHKIWFSDRELTGRMIVTRFDQRRGCIEGYQLLGVSRNTRFEHWSADTDVIIHSFEPSVKLHLDKPVLHFGVDNGDRGAGSSSQGMQPDDNRFSQEIPMMMGDHPGFVRNNFMLTRALDPDVADENFAKGFPYGYVWPPPCVPAHTNVSGIGQDTSALRSYDLPRCRSQVCDQSFRIRQWMEMPGTPSPLVLQARTNGIMEQIMALGGLAEPDNMRRRGGVGVHLGEEVTTYSTLDPALYTPTPTKPWRGIWVGDYSGHGCEFILVNQPDDEPATDEELGLFRDELDTDEHWEKRRTDARIYRGRLEAIKLTGDPNVPRGEYTFVADDLGPNGFVENATEEPFVGARVVHSKGHIAATGFVGGECHSKYH
jgi:hypothetical protein